MGCQSDVILSNNLTFSIVTHDPDTGVETDADSDPTYRIYEDETPTPILTGIMTKLDDANTTGFYTELIPCTVANGFETGKSYSIKITATVDSDTGGISYGFTIKEDLVTTTYAEPSSVPPATASLEDKISWLFTLSRNKILQTSALQTLRNDADSADIATSVVSDDGTTATRDEWT